LEVQSPASPSMKTLYSMYKTERSSISTPHSTKPLLAAQRNN
jgi:hypothetical protein